MPQPYKISFHGPVCSERLKSCVENGRRSCVIWPLNAVMHPLALASRLYYPCTAKVGEVPRYLRLPLLQYFDEVTDTDFAAVHEIQQPQTSGISKR